MVPFLDSETISRKARILSDAAPLSECNYAVDVTACAIRGESRWLPKCHIWRGGRQCPNITRKMSA